MTLARPTIAHEQIQLPDIPTQMFIGGRWSDATSTFVDVNPATERELGHIAKGTPEDIDDAVRAARKALDGEWGATPGAARGRLLNRLADLIERDAETLATLEALDIGKPISQPRSLDIPQAAATFRHFAGWADKVNGQAIQTAGYLGRPTHSYTRREPVGVIGAIVPWNTPLMITAWKLAAGNTMPFFLRPPSTTLVGPGATVRIPASTEQFDRECELAVFVGRRLRDATRQEAGAAIAGYAIGLDLSCRDLIQVDNDLKVDLVRGKAQDTMAPCGPWITPAAFAGDVDDLRVQLWVNEQQMMDASTTEMLFKVDEQLQVISQYLTIEPGDILFTGSPAGSAGEHGNRWLKPSDRIHATIGDLGPLDVEMTAGR